MKIVKGTNHGGRGETQKEQGQRERGGEQEKEFQGDELADEKRKQQIKKLPLENICSFSCLLWTPY